MTINIIQTVVAVNRCIGCGVCAAICPVDILVMRFNIYGIYQPVESDGCLERCTLCLDVCPFFEKNKYDVDIASTLFKTQDNMLFHTNLGYFIKTYEVHKHDINDRLMSASGGAGHALLNTLLYTNKVNAIIAVEANSNPDKLFKFSVFRDTHELDSARGSVYYPTELSEVIHYVMENDGNYAVTALPCYAKAIRLAQQKNKKLRERVKYIIGLVCGQMKTKEFTHKLARNIIGTDRLASVRYRVKQSDKSANNFAFEFTGLDGSVGRVSFKDKTSGPYTMWMSRMFTPPACNNCTDVFAHCADISLMDAWLSEYSNNYKGHTLVIIRNKEIDNVLQITKDVNVSPIQHQKVFNSQKAVVANKNYVANGCNHYLLNNILKLKLDIQYISLTNSKNSTTEIATLLKKLSILEKLYRFLSIPKLIVNRLKKRIIDY